MTIVEALLTSPVNMMTLVCLLLAKIQWLDGWMCTSVHGPLTWFIAFVKDPEETVFLMNLDLVKIGHWANKCKVIFNAKKSKDMIFMKSKGWSNLSPPSILHL